MKAIGVTPAGRKRHLEVLVPHLQAARAEFDHWQLWVNTRNTEDTAYLRELVQQDPWFRLVENPGRVAWKTGLGSFYGLATDPGAIYVRVDDDVCWIDCQALSRLLRFRETDSAFLVLGNVVNHNLCTYLHQRVGAIPLDHGVAGLGPEDGLATGNGEFARRLHRAFLAALAGGRVRTQYAAGNWRLLEYEPGWGTVCSWRGQDMTACPLEHTQASDLWLTHVRPKELSQPNVICGSELFVHFATARQRPVLDATDLLGRYATLVPEDGI